MPVCYTFDMKRRKRFTIFLIILTAVVSVSACRSEAVVPELPETTPVQHTPEPVEIKPYVSPTPEISVSPNEIIYGMLARYARGDDGEETLRAEDLELLQRKDSLSAYQWESILAFFDAARETEIHYGVLPDGLNDTDALCIVVMGYQLNKYGSMQPELTQRLEVALESAKKYPNAYLLCSGGGTAEKNSKVTEADVMSEWLVGKGVEPDRIIVENKSRSTIENAKYIFRKLRQYPQIREIAIVSSGYHILRASVLVQASLILYTKSIDEAPVRVVSNAACRIDKEDVSNARIVKSILQLTDDEELLSLVRNEDFISKPS